MLKQKIQNLKKFDSDNQILFYFGVPSKIFQIIIQNIVASEIINNYDCKLILEKPIGTDFKSCSEIINQIQQKLQYNTDNVFILDHYLGKSSIKNLINQNLI